MERLQLPDDIVAALHAAPFEKIIDLWQSVIELFGVRGKAALGRADRFYLLTVLLHRQDAINPWLYQRCREVEANPDEHLDLWARFHYKSTIITFAGSIQEVLRDPEITIGLFAYVKALSAKFLGQIKYELETNQELKETYPDVLWADPKRDAPRVGAKWNDYRIDVKRATNPKEGTVEAHGLTDGQPVGAHFKLRVYDDVVTRESVTTPDMVRKTTECWELSDNLKSTESARRWHIGTRYCTVAGTKILMADWSHKPIEDVQPGDAVIGWERRTGKRWLKVAKVVDVGCHRQQPVNRYTFDSGRSVVCTPDHRWWRGAHGSGDEYQPLTVPAMRNRRKDGVVAINNPSRIPDQRKGMAVIRELLVPVCVDQSREAGWLAGLFDGEGTTKKNKHHPSGIPCITQTLHNPEIIDELRRVLSLLGFEWSESWIDADGRERMNSDRCVFSINGGWRERYRFLAQLAPTKRRNLAPTLLGQVKTTRRRLVSVEGLPAADVFWLETETGNYVADGFCSKNSFADTYGEILERGILKARIYPATHDGTPGGKPVFLSPQVWEDTKINQRTTLAAQMLQNPAAGHEAIFRKEDLRFIDIRPHTLNVYILGDPASSKKKNSDNTVLAVIGVDAARNKYLLDGYRQKMNLQERWTALLQLRRRWMRDPGTQAVHVGYERFGMRSDLEYFEEQMERTGESFPIAELAWPQEGPGSKIDRIQRLVPDFGFGRFYLPMAVTKEVDGKRVASESARQVKMREGGEPWRIFKPTVRRDHEGNAYSLTKVFLDEYLVYPFSKTDDFLDACSRLYDMDYQPPVIVDQRSLEPEVE